MASDRDLALAKGLVYLKCLEEGYTLRTSCSRYVSEGGIVEPDCALSELHGSEGHDIVLPMRLFSNPAGHVVQGDEAGERHIICYPPTLHCSPQAMSSALLSDMSALSDGYLWCPSGTVSCRWQGAGWVAEGLGVAIDRGVQECLDRLRDAYEGRRVISAYNSYAPSERASSRLRHYEPLYPKQEPTSLVSGVFGTLHINQLIDYVPFDVPYDEMRSSRASRDDELGIICCSFTPHSQEAGRMRRVVHGTVMRIMSRATAYVAACIVGSCPPTQGGWLLHCMGHFALITEEAVRLLVAQTISRGKHLGNMYSMHIFRGPRVVSVSVSSGVLLTKTPKGGWMDSLSISLDRPHPVFTKGLFSTLTKVASTHFTMVPFIGRDRPPRTLIGSVHSLQAFTLPFTSGPNRAAPNYVSRPLTRTAITKLVCNEMESVAHSTPLALPGLDLCVCLANLNDNYEDCLVVSKGALDRGMFSMTVTSTHKISPGEQVPPSGGKVSTTTHRWWKPSVEGTVSSVALGPTGDKTVVVTRNSALVTGDKLATQHGQKGVVLVVPEVDMPWGVNCRGETVGFDMVMAVSSVVNRVTLGQYAELVASMESLYGLHASVETSTHHEVQLYDGVSGSPVTRRDPTSRVEVPVLASYGVCRVWQLNHLAYDKRHYTHAPVSSHSPQPPKGRTKGGGIRLGEMELHALMSSGLYNCASELWLRKDSVVVDICQGCSRLALLCDCAEPQKQGEVCLPYHTILADCIMAIEAGRSMRYF